MVDKKSRRKSDRDIDLLVTALLAHARRKIEREIDSERLREQILTDAEVVARWKARPFYIS